MLSKKATEYLDDLVELGKRQGYKIDSVSFYNTYAALTDSEKNQDTLLEMQEYLSGRNIEIISDDVEQQNENESCSIDERIRPFDPTKIKIGMAPMALQSLVERIENEEIDLNTDFQRKSGLWSNVKKSQLIESLLLKIPLPAFYFDASNEDKWLIIDGLQRITAFNEFIVKKTLKLEGMEFFSDLNDLCYDQLPRQFARRIGESSLIVYTVNDGTPKNVKYNIFKRLNTGGMELEPQEIRHALYHQGHAVGLLKKLASSQEFLKATCHSIKTERMLDQEFVLRFISVCYYGAEKYEGILDDFLNDTIEYINKLDSETILGIENEFRIIMTVMCELFDNAAFRKMSIDGRRRPINKAIFEMWCKVIFDLTEEQRSVLAKQKSLLKKKYIILCERPDFLTLVKSSDKTSYLKRIRMLKNIVEEVI